MTAVQGVPRLCTLNFLSVLGGILGSRQKLLYLSLWTLFTHTYSQVLW